MFLVKAIAHFKEREKRNRGLVRFAISSAAFIVLVGLNTFLIIKYIYDNRGQIAETADKIITSAIDKTAEYTVRGAIATASTFSKAYDAGVIKQFENLSITYSSSKYEFDKDKDKKIYEIELVLDNSIPSNEEIYFGSLVQKNYLIACDGDDFVYEIIPEDGDAGYAQDRELIALVEFFVGREYTKYGKILPGKSRHKILAVVPNDVEIKYLLFLGKRIDIN